MELKFDSRTDLINAFATPIYFFQVDESERLNQALTSLVLVKEAESPGLRRSNVGGWHSDDTLFSWNDRAVDVLREATQEALRTVVPLMIEGDCTFDVRLTAWANVSRYGAYAKRHNHPECQISAVYYVAAGDLADEDTPESGVFEFLDPRPHAEMSALEGEPIGRVMSVQPSNGRMILFPSWMYHQVNPYYGDGERISIAINAHISNLTRT